MDISADIIHENIHIRKIHEYIDIFISAYPWGPLSNTKPQTSLDYNNIWSDTYKDIPINMSVYFNSENTTALCGNN